MSQINNSKEFIDVINKEKNIEYKMYILMSYV